MASLVQIHDRMMLRRDRSRRLAERCGSWMQLWIVISIGALALAYYGKIEWIWAALVAFGQSVLVVVAWTANLFAYRFENTRRATERKATEQEGIDT